MRGATECAKRLKLVFSTLRSKLGKVSRPASTDPITQLLLGILARNVPESKAREGLDRLRGMVVDFNELRVIPAIELSEALDDFPDTRLKCEDISRALNGVFATEHTVSLDGLADLGKKELAAVLDQIDGLEAYSRARIRLLGLQQHAIPLDEAMWALARKMRIVDQRCDLEVAQAFLERQIPEDDALEFIALLRKQAWAELGAAVRGGKVERIISVPPDRTARNMLQMVSAGGLTPLADSVPPVTEPTISTESAPQKDKSAAQATQRVPDKDKETVEKKARPKAVVKTKKAPVAKRAKGAPKGQAKTKAAKKKTRSKSKVAPKSKTKSKAKTRGGAKRSRKSKSQE